MKNLILKIKLAAFLLIALTSIVGMVFLIKYIRSHNIVVRRVY